MGVVGGKIVVSLCFTVRERLEHERSDLQQDISGFSKTAKDLLLRVASDKSFFSSEGEDTARTPPQKFRSSQRVRHRGGGGNSRADHGVKRRANRVLKFLKGSTCAKILHPAARLRIHGKHCDGSSRFLRRGIHAACRLTKSATSCPLVTRRHFLSSNHRADAADVRQQSVSKPRQAPSCCATARCSSNKRASEHRGLSLCRACSEPRRNLALSSQWKEQKGMRCRDLGSPRRGVQGLEAPSRLDLQEQRPAKRFRLEDSSQD